MEGENEFLVSYCEECESYSKVEEVDIDDDFDPKRIYLSCGHEREIHIETETDGGVQTECTHCGEPLSGNPGEEDNCPMNPENDRWE